MAENSSSRRVDPGALVERMLGGDRLALARLITHVENRTRAVPAIMKAVYPRARRGYVVGAHRAAGGGEVDRGRPADRPPARGEGRTVGIVAVDPSSPFTGGAVLGDRIRMQAHALDPGVFIRSMATRGSLGGLARATAEVLTLLRGLRLRLGARRDRGRGPDRARHHAAGRYHRGGAGAGVRRRHPDDEGGADGGRRPLRGEQGRPRRARPR